jgi:hypothetical protein
MSYQIQRLTFGGILDQAVRLMRDHFVTLTAGLIAVFVPFHVIQYSIKMIRMGAGQSLGAGPWMALLWLLVLALLMPFAQLMVTVAITDCYLGKPTDVTGSARKAWSCFRPYFGTTMLSGLGVFGALLLFVLPGFYFMVCWALIGPVMVVEHVYGTAALKRSRALVKGYFGRTLSIMLVSVFLVSAVGMGVQGVLGLIPWLGAALSGAVAGITTTYTSAVMIVLYIDLRCRHENFDLQLMAAQVAALGGQPSNVRPGDVNAPAA